MAGGDAPATDVSPGEEPPDTDSGPDEASSAAGTTATVEMAPAAGAGSDLATTLLVSDAPSRGDSNSTVATFRGALKW